MRIYLKTNELITSNCTLYKNDLLKISFTFNINILTRKFEKTKKIQWFAFQIDNFNKTNKQMYRVFYKTLLKEFINNFAYKLFVNVYQQIQLLEKNSNSKFNLNPKNLILKIDKMTPTLKNRFVSLIDKKRNDLSEKKTVYTFEAKNQKKDRVVNNSSPFSFIAFNKKHWLILECFVFYHLKYLFSSIFQNFKTNSYLGKTFVFSSYNFFLYNFILNIVNTNLLKNINISYGNFILFFKEKQFFKNSLLLFFFNFIYENQRSLINYLTAIYNNLKSVYDCLNIISTKLNKNLYFLTKFEIFHSFENFLIKQTKFITWLSANFSSCFLNINKYLFILFIRNNNNKIKYLKNFFLTYICLNVDRVYFFIYCRNKNFKLCRLSQDFKSEQFFIFYKNLMIFFTTEKDNLNSLLNIIKTQYNNFGLEIKNYKTAHSSFPLFNKKPGFDFKGFHFHQKMFLRIKTKKHNYFIMNNSLKFLPFWHITPDKDQFCCSPCLLHLLRRPTKPDCISDGKSFEDSLSQTAEARRRLAKRRAIKLIVVNTEKKKVKVKRFEKKVVTWKTYTFPAIHYLLVYLKNLKKIVNKSRVDSQDNLIKKLKSQITNWCGYYQFLLRRRANFKTLQICDYLLSKWLWRWACRRHSNKSHYWIRNKYYILNKSGNNLKWEFCVFNKTTNIFDCLPKHTKIKKFHFTKVNWVFSLYDENWKYWYVQILLLNKIK